MGSAYLLGLLRQNSTHTEALGFVERFAWRIFSCDIYLRCFGAAFTSCSPMSCPLSPMMLPGRDGDPGTPSLLGTGVKQQGWSAPRILAKVVLEWYPPLRGLLTRCFLSLPFHPWEQFLDLYNLCLGVGRICLNF